jgi:hypothetical protein
MCDVIPMPLIFNDEIHIFMLMENLHHHQPGSLDLELIALIMAIMRPLQPGAFMFFPFGRQIQSIIHHDLSCMFMYIGPRIHTTGSQAAERIFQRRQRNSVDEGFPRMGCSPADRRSILLLHM